MDNGTIGKLYLCATPIGNLEDITLRALRILKEVDFIAAEDTRHTIKLLNHFGIKKPLISYHEHNKRDKGEEILGLIRRGLNVALVSDAGMPGISDPGSDLVVQALASGIFPTIIPGPSAALSALVLSGLSTERFVFEGFLPRDKRERQDRLSGLMEEERTIIFYEAPHRLITTLKDFYKTFYGERKITLVRELTKVYEEILPMDIKTAVLYYEERRPRGEYVLVLEGAVKKSDTKDYSNINIEDHLKAYLDAGLEKKEAIRQVAKDRDIPKNQVYKYSIDIE